MHDILKRTEIFILNKEEAGFLVDGKNIDALLAGLRKLGPRIVVVTDGKRGASAFDGEYVYSTQANRIKVVETTGAGDAFASSFLSGIIKRNDIKFAMQLGQANAESVIQSHGAKTGLLKYSEASGIIKKKREKVVKKKCGVAKKIRLP